MIRLITGLPGAGKSLRGVQLIQKFLAEGRPVYVDGLDGLQAFGWEPCNAREWEKLPDGSVVVVDEAQKVWPTRRSGEPSPDIRALSEHRHHGLDFVLLTQHPTMMDSYVRKLVGQHEHIVRQFGMEASRIFTWTEAQDDPGSLGTRQRGTDALWKYPRDCFPLYKSATLHTVKRRIPLRLAIIPFLLVLAGLLAWWAYGAITGIASTDAGTAAAEAGKVGAPVEGYLQGASGVQSSPLKYADATSYVAAFLPRIPAQPWSAPAFDDREVRAEPEMYCVLSEVKGCRCYSEQVTRMFVEPAQCLRAVAYGSYNPFRTPRVQSTATTAQASQAQPTRPPVRDYEALPVPPASDGVLRAPISAGSAWPVSNAGRAVR